MADIAQYALAYVFDAFGDVAQSLLEYIARQSLAGVLTNCCNHDLSGLIQAHGFAFSADIT